MEIKSSYSYYVECKESVLPYLFRGLLEGKCPSLFVQGFVRGFFHNIVHCTVFFENYLIFGVLTPLLSTAFRLFRGGKSLFVEEAGLPGENHC